MTDNFERGFNANLLETFAWMLLAIGTNVLEFQVNWSPLVQKPGGISSEILRFDGKMAEALQGAANRLRSRGIDDEAIVRGRIVRLGLDTSVSSPRTITLETEINNAVHHIRITLDDEAYRIACDAHRDGQEVTVTGQLQRERRLYRLLQPHDLFVI